jgi:hypothetical protein
MSKKQVTHKWLQGGRKNQVKEGTKLSQTYVTFKYHHPWCKSLQKQASEVSKEVQSLVFLMYKLHPILDLLWRHSHYRHSLHSHTRGISQS